MSISWSGFSAPASLARATAKGMATLRVPSWSVSTRMVLLVLAIALPMNIVIIAVIANLASAANEAQRASLMFTARSIAAGVDAELGKYKALGDALSRSPALLDDDLGAFEMEARRAFPDVTNAWVVVADPGGQQIMNLSLQPNQKLPRRTENGIAAQRRAFESGRPTVSDALIAPLTQTWVATIEFPILKNGQPYRALSITMQVKLFFQLLNAPETPRNWLTGIIDKGGHFIARVPDNERRVGQLASEGWRKVKHLQGLFEITSLEGDETVVANAHSAISDWTIGTSLRVAELQSAAWHSVRWALWVGGGLSLLSLVLASVMARSIAGSITQLRAGAETLLKGGDTALKTDLPEISEVWDDLHELVAQRDRADQSLRQSEARLASALKAGGFGVYDYDTSTGLIQCDATVRQLWGMPDATDVTYQLLEGGIHPDDRAAVVAAMRCALDPAGPGHFEAQYRVNRHDDGRVRWVLAEGDATFEGGKPVRLLGTVRDITERKLAEQALRMSEHRLSAILDALPIGVALIDRDGVQVIGNQGFREFVPGTIPSVDAPSSADWEGYDEQGNRLERYNYPSSRALRGERVWPGQEFLFHGDAARGPIWTRVAAIPFLGEGGSVIGATLIIVDIDQQKRTRDTIRQSEQRYRLALQTGGLGAWEVDAASGIRRWTPEAMAIFGLELEGGIGRYGGDDDELLGRVHPDDRSLFAHFDELARQHDTFPAEYRIVHPQTGVRWVSGRGAILARDSAGVPLNSIHVAADVTERKLAEEALLESERRLRYSLRAASAGAWDWDIQTGSTVWSPENYALHDVDPEGGPPHYADWQARLHPDDREGTNSAVREVVGGRAGEFRAEFRIVRRDGQIRWLLGLGRVERSVDGTPLRMSGINIDITERKQAEEQIGLLMGEVNHRSKNLLGLVQAIARRTAATEPKDFVARFEERVAALAASQDLLVKSAWRGVALDELVRSQLAHFKDVVDTRIRLTGPAVSLTATAAQTIGMALHELATNAGKYGALATDRGNVAITWDIEHRGGKPAQFTIHWSEHGGPAVSPPARRGFGCIVIGDMARMNLNADVMLGFAESGVTWRLACLATMVVDGPVALPPDAAAASRRIPRPGAARVLVVEDEGLVALEIAEHLTEAGYEVVGPASSVAQALDLLRHAECNAAVLDVNLGAETSELVALQLRSRRTPFLVISGYSREQHPPAFKDARSLPKPLRKDDFIAEVARCLEAAAGQPPSA